MTPVEALAQQMVPRGSPAQPLARLEGQYAADCSVFATMHFRFSREETFGSNKHSPGLKNEHPKNMRNLVLERGGQGRVTVWKSWA